MYDDDNKDDSTVEESIDVTKLYGISPERLKELKREMETIEIEVLEDAMRDGKL